MRIPANIASRAEGIAISKSICRRLALKMVPISRYSFNTLKYLPVYLPRPHKSAYKHNKNFGELASSKPHGYKGHPGQRRNRTKGRKNRPRTKRSPSIPANQNTEGNTDGPGKGQCNKHPLQACPKYDRTAPDHEWGAQPFSYTLPTPRQVMELRIFS